MLSIPAGSTGRMVKAKPVAKVESKEARPARTKQDGPKQEVPKVRTERTRTRTKKFKES
jgi:hypothetical protein